MSNTLVSNSLMNEPPTRSNKKKQVKVLAVGAGKGGVGKSSISLNLALALQKQGKKVLLLDGDLGLANINVMLGMIAKKTLADVVSGKANLNEIILKGPYGLEYIPGATGLSSMASLSNVEHAGIVDAFNELTRNLDYLVVDTAAGLSDAVLCFMRSSQELLVIICDEPTSITDAYALIKVMHKRYQVNRFNIVANFVKNNEEGRILYNKLCRVSDRFLDVSLNYMGEIPFCPLVHQGIKSQSPVLTSYPEAKSSKAFNKLAKGIENLPWAGLMNGNTGFFIQKMVYG